MDKKSKWALGMGGLAIFVSINFGVSLRNYQRANNKIEELEAWRSSVVEDCVRYAVKKSASDFLQNKFPEMEACMKGINCYPSDPEASLWGSVEKAYTTGYVPEEPWPSSRDYLLTVADRGSQVRGEAEKKCSETPILYIKSLVRE